MLGRQTTGSVVCASCGRLVAVNDERCHNCGRRHPGLWGFAPVLRSLGRDLGFVPIVLGGCLLLYVVALALDPSEIARGGLFSLLSPGRCSQFLLGASGGFPVFGYERWWTPLSAAWLHGGLLHIGFNLYWVRQLGPAMAELYGPGRSAIIYVVSSVAGFALTSSMWFLLPGLPGALRGAYITVGASAAIFGWLGALIYYGRRTGSTHVRQQLLGFALPLFVLGLLIPMVDNWAHLGGFGAGYGAARFLDPLAPERGDHLLIGLACLVASLLAVVASIVHGLPLGPTVGCDF